MNKTAVLLVRRVAVGVLAAGLAAAAHARVDWSIGFDLGQPYVATLPLGAISVQVGGGHGRHGHHRGHGYRPWHFQGSGMSWVWVAPPVMFPLERSIVVAAPALAPLPATPSRPDPVIYPRHGQDARQTEYDRQECNRWATTQPSALADAAVFHRAVDACMDGRGYTQK